MRSIRRPEARWHKPRVTQKQGRAKKAGALKLARTPQAKEGDTLEPTSMEPSSKQSSTFVFAEPQPFPVPKQGLTAHSHPAVAQGGTLMPTVCTSLSTVPTALPVGATAMSPGEMEAPSGAARAPQGLM